LNDSDAYLVINSVNDDLEDDDDDEDDIFESKKYSRGKRKRLSSSTSVSSVSSIISTSSFLSTDHELEESVSRKDGRSIKNKSYHKSSSKRPHRMSVSEINKTKTDTTQSQNKNPRGRPKTESNHLKAQTSASNKNNKHKAISAKKIKTLNKSSKSKPKYKSKITIDESSSSEFDSESHSSLDYSFSNESSHHSNNSHKQPNKAFKSSLANKLAKQESRLTVVENNLIEKDEMWNGKNLNEIHASTSQKLAIKLALAIKGADLKDCVFTEDGEESSNSTRIPWTLDEISVFRRTMMRKCKLNSEQFFSKISQFKKAINGRSRYEHKKYLDELGVNMKSKRAKLYSKSKKNNPLSSDDEDENDSSSQINRKHRVRFSSTLIKPIDSNEQDQSQLQSNRNASSSDQVPSKTIVAATSVDNILPLQPTAGAVAAATYSHEDTPSILILNYFKKIKKSSTQISNEK
jgi:hypothetical protein